jgi:hypothetical protein
MAARRFDGSVPGTAERGAGLRSGVAGTAPTHPAHLDAAARTPVAATRPFLPVAATAHAGHGALAATGQTLLQLQRQQGNRYVQQVLGPAQQASGAPPVLQAKLVLGPPADRYEREADQVARQVLRRTTPPPPTAGAGDQRVMRTPVIQRVHSAGAGPVDTSVQQAIQGARGGGRPLPDPVRGSMEAALGADFGGVRLHTGARADQLARALQARAFTTGQDIFFRRGQDVSSPASREVLAHELTHVVQQGGGSSPHTGTTAPQVPPGARMSDRVQRRMGFEFETTAQVRGAFKPNQPNSYGPFPDEEEFYREHDWKIVPDESRMEFVSDPLTTLAQLQTATRQIEAFINSVRSVQRGTDIRATHAGTWTAPAWAQAGYTVHVGSGLLFDADVAPTDWYGQPQVSVGIRTDRVARFLSQARTTRVLPGLKRQINFLASTDQAPPMPTKGIDPDIKTIPQLMKSWDTKVMTEGWLSNTKIAQVSLLMAAANVTALPPVEQEKLRGLWMLMKAYWTNLARIKVAGSYRKTSLQALARTDFRSFYNDLSPAAKRAFKAAKDTFAPAGDLRQTKKIAGTQITLRRWYASIIRPEAGSKYQSKDGSSRPVDLLSANTSPTGEEISRGTDKSMGEFPLDNQAGPPRAVFELRRITPGARIPIRLMYEYLLKPIFEMVHAVEQ